MAFADAAVLFLTAMTYNNTKTWNTSKKKMLEEDEFDEEAVEDYYAECYSGWEEITKEEYEEER
jgi:hypothetical protein